MGTTNLVCTVCNLTIDLCKCPNTDGNLWESFHNPRNVNVMAKWCRACDKHFARCKCDVPDFYILSAGRDVTRDVFTTVDGKKVRPILTER